MLSDDAVLGVALALGGFGVAVSMSSTHFTSVHSWFGMSVLALSVITPALGWAADLVYNPRYTQTCFIVMKYVMSEPLLLIVYSQNF
jgi:hypothetical protein